MEIRRPEPPRRQRSTLASSTRWLIRIVLVAAIFAIAIERGLVGEQLYGVVLAVAWAAILPFFLRMAWVVTRGRETWQRYVVLALVAAVLLVGFVFGVRPLLRPG